MARMTDLALHPASRPVEGVVRPPGSKSQTVRALLLAALAEGRSQIDRLLLADDTRLMVDALRGLGVLIALEESALRASVSGCGGRWPNDAAQLFCGNAGTVARFLTAACCLGTGEYVLDGSSRMRCRPMRPLVDALRDLGAQLSADADEDFLPLRVAARGLRGGRTALRGAESSQFLSALLMAAPRAAGDVFIEATGTLVSAPYVRMTLAMMEESGAAVLAEGLERFVVPAPQAYAPATIEIEPDATAASYFFAAAAVTGGRVTVPGLGCGSVQGDLAFLDVLRDMGCVVEQSPDATTVIGPRDGALRGVHADLQSMPDVAPTLAVLALFAAGPTRLRRVAHLRHKESDRLAALGTGLSRLGAEVEFHEDGLTIHPPPAPRPAEIETHDDHRMVMSFALATLRLDGIVLRDVECVAKSYPGFFDDWRRLTGQVQGTP